MKISDILLKSSIVPNLTVESKKQVLEKLSEIASPSVGIDQSTILDALIERERLGTTGVGHGVALPHTRLIGLDKIFCAFVKTNPIDFESVDGKLIDLVFVLLVPEEAGADHLKALSRLSRLLRDEEIANQLRKENDIDALYNIIIQHDIED
ncbi:MAG: PTS sugar transporter subunit IIA [Alphaproteobacteria bacterium]|nr:PTS sugar transporter subunit IIA [Alphaproteobacteria bacterium]MBQ9089972.1 PTS sugar transporter subunit IIA [Alphaproteobacteria bacterium]